MTPEAGFNGIVDDIVGAEHLKKIRGKLTDGAPSKDTKWPCSKTVIPWIEIVEKGKDKPYCTGHMMQGGISVLMLDSLYYIDTTKV